MQIPEQWQVLLKEMPDLEEDFISAQKGYEHEWIPPYFFHYFRPYGKGLEAFLTPFPKGEEIWQRVKQTYEVTEDEYMRENEEGTACYAAYFVHSKKGDISEEEILDLGRQHAEAMYAMLKDLEESWAERFPKSFEESFGHIGEICMESIEIIDHREYREKYDKDELLEADLYDCRGDWFNDLHSECEDEFPDNPLYSLYAEPLYHIMLDYNIASYITWPLVSERTAVEDPFEPYFKLWLLGYKPVIIDEKHMVIVK